jgi:CysZ protein
MKNFIKGCRVPLASISFILKNPKLIKYLLLPFCMSSMVLVITFLLWQIFQQSIIDWMGISATGYFSWFVTIFMWFIYAIFSLYCFTIIGMIAATPFNDLLSRRVLEIRGVTKFSEIGFIESSVKSLLEILKLTGLKCLLLLFATFFIPPLAIFVLMFFIGWDYFDYPMNQKIQGLKKKALCLSSHKGVFIGFASIHTLLFMVPFAGLILMPIAVVGASLLFESNDN